MVEDSSIQEERKVRQLRHATFECASCGSGTEHFTSLFEKGCCGKCGAPAGVIVETSRPEDIERIKESVVLIYPDGEEDNAARIRKDISEEGVNVIDLNIVVENEQAGNRASVLAFIVDNARYILVIPPEEGQFSEDRLVSASVEQSIGSQKYNIIPLYPNESYRGRSSFLDTRTGVRWEGEGTGKAVSKDRFLNLLKANPSRQD